MDSSTKLLSPRQRRSCDLIITAASEEFTKRGFDAVSMSDIAARAGLARMTIYNLFERKEDIAHAIGYRMAEIIAPHFQSRIDANESAAMLIKEALMGGAQWCLDNPTIAPIVLMGPKHKQLDPPKGEASFHALIHDFFALGQAQGLFRTDQEANDLSLVLLGGYAHLMLFALAGGPFDMSRIDLLLRINLEGANAPKHSKN